MSPGPGFPAKTPPVVVFPSRNIPAAANTNRREKRAIVKAIGARQVKKIYRKAQA